MWMLAELPSEPLFIFRMHTTWAIINNTYSRQCSFVLLFGITRLRLSREQIKNRLYVCLVGIVLHCLAPKSPMNIKASAKIESSVISVSRKLEPLLHYCTVEILIYHILILIEQGEQISQWQYFCHQISANRGPD